MRQPRTRSSPFLLTRKTLSYTRNDKARIQRGKAGIAFNKRAERFASPLCSKLFLPTFAVHVSSPEKIGDRKCSFCDSCCTYGLLQFGTPKKYGEGERSH